MAEDNQAMAGQSADEDDRKLFVGGLPQEVSEEELNEHFGQFGEIESVNLKTDPNTGRSRGFCFVVYKGVDGLEKAVATEDHTLQNKKVAVKKAQAKQGKIYVGKIPQELSDEEIKSFFEQYGAIVTVEQPFDKMKNERKNFCFVTFEKEEPAKKLLKEETVNVSGNELVIKKVTPKQGDMRGGGRGGRGGGGFGGGQWGGYGGGWGGYGGYDQWGGYGGYDQMGGGGGQWGGYGGYGGQQQWGAGGGQQWGAGGGKAPGGARGRGAPRGRGMRGQRQKPY